MVWRQVTECSNIEPHDWTLCAFAHVGEKARRRGTAVYKYVATACPDFRKVRISKTFSPASGLCLLLFRAGLGLH